MNKIIPILLIGILLASGFQASAFISNKEESNPVFDNNQELFDDNLDQYMTDYQEASVLPVGAIVIAEPLNIHFSIAQSFIPQEEVITRAQLYVGRNASASYGLVLSIREELTGEDLTQVTVPVDEFVIQNFSWVEFDFDDIPVTVDETYYMVAYTNNVSDNWYLWGGNVDNLYADGCAWASVDDGDTWTNDSISVMNQQSHYWNNYNGLLAPSANDSMDMCFMTYGKDNLPPTVPDITGPSEIPPGGYNYTFTSTDPENENIYYMVDWGDGTTSDWLGPYESGETAFILKAWDTQGTYIIRAKARDASGHESDWGELEVIVPINNPVDSPVKTFVWGVILFPRIRDRYITFRAVNVHYRIIGQRESGVFMHKKLTFDSEFKGTIRNHWVCAIFNGTPLYR